MPLNIAIIEDDPLLCEELVEYFGKNDMIQPVLVVESIPKFQRFFREFMNINIILLDINLPEMSGADGIALIRRLVPEAEIVMHTVVNDYDTIFKCICLGANGYLLKDGDLEKLKTSLLEVEENGGCALTPSVARRILTYFQPKSKTLKISSDSLSDQELTISRLLVDGLSYKEVAESIGISVNGVRYHVKNIYKKLHVHSKVGMLKRLKFSWLKL